MTATYASLIALRKIVPDYYKEKRRFRFAEVRGFVVDKLVERRRQAFVHFLKIRIEFDINIIWINYCILEILIDPKSTIM